MNTSDVVHLFEGKRSSVKTPGLVGRAWKRVTGFVATVAEIARESRELERKLLNQRGHRRFCDY